MDDILGMSDEEFAKLQPEGISALKNAEKEQETPEDKTPDEPSESQSEDSSAPSDEGREDPQKDLDEPIQLPEEEDEGNKEGDEPANDESVDGPKNAENQPFKDKDSAEPNKEEDPKDPPPSDINYEEFYKQVMAPFKANGKTIQLQNAGEVISMMQMGANYTKKMQAIKGYSKVITMLENNGLLDEDKLSFYIDLDKKDPEAIRKFLKDSEIDPMDLDTSSEIKYNAGRNKVTDQEAHINSVISELRESDSGLKTLQSAQTWDQQSRKVVWENPEILRALQVQQENGIFEKITTEIERRKLLGQIPDTIPFLQAYKLVGDELFAQPQQPAASPQRPVTRAPIATSRKTLATKAAETSKARAAAAPRSSSPSTKAIDKINPLAMSDEEFLKLKI